MIYQSIVFTNGALDYLRARKSPEESIEHLCNEQIRRSYKQLGTLAPYFRAFKPTSILDIGCGLGMIDVLLGKAFDCLKVIHLLDGANNSEPQGDFREGMKPWNDVYMARDFVQANFVENHLDTKLVHAHTPKEYIEPFEVDCVISLKSWGTHYPISTYFGFVQMTLERGGLLVVDLHPDTDPLGRQLLLDSYRLLAIEGRRKRLHVFTTK